MAGNLQRSKAWIPPWVSPHTALFPLSRAHSALFFPSAPAKRSDGQEEHGAGSPRDPADTASTQEPPQGVVGPGPCPPLSLATPHGGGEGGGRLQDLSKVVITLLEEASPPFSGSRAPSASGLPSHPPRSCPKMQVSVWDTYEEHACGGVCSPRRPASGIHLPYVFLEACRPGPS